MKAIASSTAAVLIVIAAAPLPVVALLLAVIASTLGVAAIVHACGGRDRKGRHPAIAIRAGEAATPRAADRDRVRGSSC